MNTADSISVTDRKIIRKSVESVLARYRLYKYLTFEEREASVTASYEAREGGGSNKTIDQTGSIAAYNIDNKTERKAFCERVERAVERLPSMERLLIEERYMGQETEYITDYSVYCHRFDPPISEGTYSKIRNRAMYRLAIMLGLMSHQ
ncbi:ArpU family phage packaging/lysis transcriptional regulator [Brevibacillus agri]|uniref:ArpU family phage packaging/lysis transcriptional regulator n=1 Tax=Brevibacillus agri TaxID=51101 RepID=UPI003D1CDBFA